MGTTFISTSPRPVGLGLCVIAAGVALVAVPRFATPASDSGRIGLVTVASVFALLGLAVGRWLPDARPAEGVRNADLRRRRKRRIVVRHLHRHR